MAELRFLKRVRRSLFHRQNLLPLGVVLLSLGAYYWASSHGQADILTPDGLKSAVAGTGLAGILVYISIISLAVVMSPIPGAPLTIAAGAVWGPLWAGFYSIIGGFLGSLIAYFIGRTLGKSAVHALTGKVVYFSKERGETYVGLIIFVTRLLPVLSFDLISYAAGMTGLSLSVYAPATLLGMTPSTLLLTYMGAAFTFGATASILLAVVFLAVLVVLPWGIHRHNWLGLQDIIRVE